MGANGNDDDDDDDDDDTSLYRAILCFNVFIFV